MVTYENDVVIVADKHLGLGRPARAYGAAAMGEDDVTVVENDVVKGEVTAGTRTSQDLALVLDQRSPDDQQGRSRRSTTAVDKLTGRGDDSAVIVLTTPVSGRGDEDPEATLRAFATAAQPRIDAALAAVHDEARR